MAENIGEEDTAIAASNRNKRRRSVHDLDPADLEVILSGMLSSGRCFAVPVFHLFWLILVATARHGGFHTF
jgi:hypothetical protein